MPALSDPTIVMGSPPAPPAATELDEILEEAAPTNGHAQAEAVEAPPEPEAIPEAPEAPAARAPVIPLKKRLVRGRYRSGGAGFQLELRVDAGGSRPLNRVSGDFFSTAGSTTSYFGSFVVNAPAITTTATEIRLEGMGTYTWPAGAPFIRVTIPRVSIIQPAAPATVQFITPPSTPGASYLCTFASPFFRTVQLEQDSVAGTVPFISYDTGSLLQPPSSPARVLTVPKAYAEAGIEMQVAGTANVIPVGDAGANATWSDAELHAAMVNHFSLHANVPQWRVWMLVATSYDGGGVRGIMFDYSDAFQRQGAAVFYDAIQGADAATQRAALRTYVHELGHAFNLLHSWQKDLADPPQPLGSNGGLGDLSWMNYAWKYQPQPPEPGGEAAYWAGFPFQFTDSELVHLRHGFYKNVIMGANPFGKGAAEIDPELFDAPLLDQSGLELELRSKASLAYGEPAVIELKLSTTDLRGREVHGHLHPNDDLVSVAIQQPSGRTVLYRPMLLRCIDEDRRMRLDAERPAIYSSAYIGFGKDGFTFAQPGVYRLRAQYVAPDGSRVMSGVLELRVQPPATPEDARVGELLLGEQQGQIFALLGSRAPVLDAGNAELDVLLEEHGDHPLAVYARLAKGIDAERDFKELTPEADLVVHGAKPEESVALLSEVERESTGDGGVDNITLNYAMRRMARAQARAEGPEAGAKVLDRMVDVFEAKQLAEPVLRHVRRQAEATKAQLAEEAAG
jgi:hypothetical protein